MNHQLSDAQVAQIVAAVPPAIPEDFNLFPFLVARAIAGKELPPFAEGYIPSVIKIYHSESPPEPTFVFQEGEMVTFNRDLLEETGDIECLQIDIDDRTAFIQIEDRVLLDRLGPVRLPEALRSIVPFVQSVNAYIHRGMDS